MAPNKRDQEVVHDAGAPAPKRSRGRPKSAQGAGDESVGREALIEITCRFLDEVPPSEVTRATIARAANVHPALIRYYFQNRDTLLRAAAEELTAQLRSTNSSSAGAAQRVVAPVQWLTSRVRNLFRFNLRHPYYHRLMREEIAQSAEQETRDLFDRQNKIVLGLYERAIAEGALSGTMRDVDASFLYLAIIGLSEVYVTGSRLLAALGIDPADPETQVRYEEFVVEMIGRMTKAG